MSHIPYASVVGSLMYAMVCTRPDLAQAVSVVSRYMGNPGMEHRQVEKRIFRYLKGVVDIGRLSWRHVMWARRLLNFDYAINLDARRSENRYAFMINNSFASWKATLQPIMALSSIEAEYMALAEAIKERI
ncbi:secreted RxLR effector protein 161-like [Glycine max]|uniref:secreted RxLR effector protein 161-like n=1 Tax=Glycine max TaxID=3847 RepID=UPI001B355273|nr:secreted RxLR effector protein 161-like [Glycine max]